MISRISFLLLLATATAAHAQVAPDLTPVKCAWASMTPEQQKALRDAFVVDNRGRGRTLTYSVPTEAETDAAARACKLSYSIAQLAEFAHALGRKSQEELSRMGINARGILKDEIVDRALTKLSDDRRQEIGNLLACPDHNRIETWWDDSLLSAMRRTGIKIMDGRTVALIALAMYGVLGQEGNMRRINGTNPPCPPPE